MRKTRTFIAVPAAEAVEIAALTAIDRLRSATDNVKWVDADNLHWTLQFLGEIDDVEIHDTCRRTMAAVAAHPPFTLVAHGVGAFPSTAKPRTVWLGVSDQPDSGAAEFCSLQGAVERQLAPLGFRGEARRFVPHVTLGRATGRGPLHAPALAEELVKLEEFEGGEQWIDEVVVYASELTRDGPVYQVLTRAPLGR